MQKQNRDRKSLFIHTRIYISNEYKNLPDFGNDVLSEYGNFANMKLNKNQAELLLRGR